MSGVERYRPVTAEIVRKLEDIVGAGGIVTDAEKLEVYSHDETSESEYVKMPEIVVKPRDASEVSRILKVGNAETGCYTHLERPTKEEGEKMEVAG